MVSVDGNDPNFYPPIRLQNEKLGRRGVFLTTLIYIIAVALFSVVGAFGPDVFNESYTELTTWHVDSNETLSWTHTFPLTSLREEEQLIFFKIQLERPDTSVEDLEVKLISTIDVIGLSDSNGGTVYPITTNNKEFNVFKFHNDEALSDPVSLWSTPTIIYDEYEVKVNFVPDDDLSQNYVLSDNSILMKPRMVYVHTDFTQWAMGWKIAFQTLTVLAMFFPFDFANGLFMGFFVQMMKVPWKQWSSMQVWVASLLVGLFFFNDPLFPVEIFADTESTAVGLIAFNVISIGAFVSMVLCFFLSTSDDISSEGMSQYMETKKAWFYVPRMVLCGALWVLLSGYYGIARLDNSGSPKYAELDDNGTLHLFKIVLGLFLGIWLCWFLVLMVKSARRFCKPQAYRIEGVTVSFAFIFVFTCISAFLMLLGVLTGSLYPLPDNSFRFLFFYSNFNVAVFVLAFAYAPDQVQDENAEELIGGNGINSSGLLDDLNQEGDHRNII